MQLFGKQHTELLHYLFNEWWKNGPPLALVQGFPGVGKTELAIALSSRIAQNHPNVLIVHLDCPESDLSLVDDLFIELAHELEAKGDESLVKRLSRGEDGAKALPSLVGAPRLIIIDEAQRLLPKTHREVPSHIARLLEAWARTANASGRVLLISNREFGASRWAERASKHFLNTLKPEEAEEFLVSELLVADRAEAVSPERRRDVVNWLGCNPRAIKLLASALRREALDDLIGLAPEAWESRERRVSPDLLKQFEHQVLIRAAEGLDDAARAYLRRLAVLRRGVNNRGLRAMAVEGSDVNALRNELLDRFILEFRRNQYEIQEVVRDTIRGQMNDRERRQAHLAAGRYHAAPFRARQLVGPSERLGGRFIEARYHFTMAESEFDLADIGQMFAQHFTATIRSTSRVPSDAQELDERIALLSALLQARGPLGLEYHLARCLVTRARTGDTQRALPHLRRATGPRAPADTWVLRIKVEDELFGYEAATKVAREGIQRIPPAQNLFSLYQIAADILARNGKADDAVALLKDGIQRIPPDKSLSSLYQCIGVIFSRLGRLDEALDWLVQGCGFVPEAYGGYRLAEAAVFLAYGGGRLDRLANETLGQAQRALMNSMQALAEGDPRRAATVGHEAIQYSRTCFALYAQTAFSWLWAGEPSRARETLAAFPLEIRHGRDESTTWLAAWIAIELDQPEEARTLIESYLDRRLDPTVEVDRALIAELWQSSVTSWDTHLNFYFPRLPSALAALLNKNIASSNTQQAVVTPSEQVGKAAQIVRAMRPDDWFGLYVLGCYDHLKTVYVQQCRALTLIHALFQMGELEAGSTLAVVGGGAGGVTAAAAAASKGARVTLFEQAAGLLPLQRQNTQRYLHPHLYHWPAAGASERRAGIPLLDWTAGRSTDVALEITQSFDALRAGCSEVLDVHLNRHIQSIEQIRDDEPKRRIRVLGDEGGLNAVFDVAIIAVGFGLEQRRRCGIDTPPYWEEDGLAQALGATTHHQQRILVSGAGDGALIDLLRATIRDFTHEEILKLLPDDIPQNFLEKLLQIEQDTNRKAAISAPQSINLHQVYSQLEIPSIIKDNLKARARLDTNVTFNFSTPGRYSPNSSGLNRLLVFALCDQGIIRPKLGKIQAGSIEKSPTAGYSVTWSAHQPPTAFDQIIIRHGPPADLLGTVFPELSAGCAPLRGRLRDLQLTAGIDPATLRFFA